MIIWAARVAEYRITGRMLCQHKMNTVGNKRWTDPVHYKENMKDGRPGKRIDYTAGQMALRTKNKAEELAKRIPLEDSVVQGMPPGIKPP